MDTFGLIRFLLAAGMMQLSKLILAVGLLLGLGSPVMAQSGCTGQFLGGTLCGNPTSSLGLPGPSSTPVLGVPGTNTGTLGFAGATSGTATITPQSAAGTPTLTLPTTTGTFADSASSPLVLNAITGVLTCPTCVTGTSNSITNGTTPTSGYTAGQLIVSNGTTVSSVTPAAGKVLAGSTPAFTATPTLGVAGSTVGTLTFANATSGSITLTPTTGALGSSVITLPAITDTMAGFALANGGTNASLTASNGGIVWSNASQLQILAGTATARQMLQSGASATPAWSTATWPVTTVAGGLLTSGTLNTVTASITPVLGVPTVSQGTLGFAGATSGTATITAQATAGTPTITLPNTTGTLADGASSPLVLSATTGNLTCSTCVTSSGGGAITGTSPIVVSAAGVVSLQGATGSIAVGSGGTGSSFTPTPTLGVAGSTVGTLTFANATSGSITLTPTTGALGTVTATLPANTGTIAETNLIQTFSAAQTFSNQLIATGTSAPSSAGGQVYVMGTIAAPTLTNTGQGAIYDTVVGGLTVQGDGSTSDFTLANKAGGTVFAVPTGSTKLNLPSLVSGTCSSGLALDSGNNLIEDACPGAAASIQVGTTTITAGTNGGCLYSNGGTLGNHPCITEAQGRLTLTANTPVMTTTAAAQTTLRYDCYIGSQVPYYDGTQDNIDTISSCEVTDAMVSAASAGQVVSGNVYDAWWVHSGANRICLAMSTGSGGGGGWASDTGGSNTARGTGFSQLDRVTRPYTTNKNSLADCFNGATNYGSVNANQATYLGTIYASANGQISWTFGAAASGGTAGLFGVWNMYNRVIVTTDVIDSGSAYTYTSATIRQTRASAGNQAQFVMGLAEDGITSNYGARSFTTAITNANVTTGVCAIDSTSSFASTGFLLVAITAAIYNQAATDSAMFPPQVGLHTVAACEKSDGSNANTFDQNSFDSLFVMARM
jgi:hypothetical protein